MPKYDTGRGLLSADFKPSAEPVSSDEIDKDADAFAIFLSNSASRRFRQQLVSTLKKTETKGEY